MKKKFYLLFLIALISNNCFSQFSKTHYLPPLSGATNVPVEQQYIYISCPSITPINFTIKPSGGTNITGTVSRDTPYVYNVGVSASNNLHVNPSDVNSVLDDKGYIIEAEDVIYVTARVIAGSGNQAGEVVSKGLAALGTQFRIGGFTNILIPSTGTNNYTFISILATENNTEVSFSNIRPGAVLLNDAGSGSTPSNVFLNAGESYVKAVQGPTSANRDALIGSLVSSDKPIAVNCGSYGGTNGEMGNQDLGFDQIVSAERTGKDYIFIKSTGMTNVERVLLIAHEDNTEIYINGATTPNYTLNAGDYANLFGTEFNTSGNLYVRSSKNIFAYQSVGDNSQPNQANQELFFVPPLSCQTPKIIDNIPFIEKIGTRNFTGRVTITTRTASTLNFTLNGSAYTLATLPAFITVAGPSAVTGNPDYECYVLTGFTGNLSVYSTSELYLAAYGSDINATFGGFYSGFTFKPEVTFQPLDLTQNNCIPNVSLEVSTLSGFNFFQWYFNDNPIPGANSSTYIPTLPGYYYVSATITTCGIPELISDKIPVSSCPTDTDNDNVNDNLDQDLDNDGIANCTESYGNLPVDLSNTAAGTLFVTAESISVLGYNNTFIGTLTTQGDPPTPTPFVGNANGSFVASVPKGENNAVTYELDFAQPLSLVLDYPATAAAGNLLNSNLSFVLSVPVNKTITVLNPTNQLLIDTNYDGIYESDVTSYSSFEIRFRYNGALTLPAGTGTFKFLTHDTSKLKFKQINLVDRGNARNSTFQLTATCVKKDSDNDGIPDQEDYDSDNDSISDLIEAQGTNPITLSNIDADGNGIYDVFGLGLTPANNDTDSYPNYLDVDSDNDGIFDIIESGSPGNATNTSGITVGNVGTNGLDDALETFPDSGILNYTVLDTDGDGIYNYLDSDSDNDGCSDIIEAGYTDANSDNIVGDDTPPIFDTYGLVISGTGYSVPNPNYIIAAPIIINTQPLDAVACELQSTTFTINSNAVTSYQWQLSTDGGTTWTDLSDTATYSGTTTITLTVSNVTPAMVGYKYRVFLNKNGNSCGKYSNAATLTTYALPVVTSPITLVQCDDNTDGFSDVNLTVKNDAISANAANEVFTFFTTLAAADTNNTALQIANPIAYNTNNTSVWVRVTNTNGCFRVAKIDVFVSVTQIPAGTQWNLYKCDDYVDAINDDRDGISGFDFTSIQNDIQTNYLPATGTYTVSYYRTESDFLSETNPITPINNYRNIGFPNTQQVWVRVDSTIDNSCYGFAKINLTVEALPIATDVNAAKIIRSCDDNQDGIFNFDTSTINSLILNGQTNVTISYTDGTGTVLSNPLPNPFTVNGNFTINYRVTNNTTQADNGPCYDENRFQFIVDDLPEAFAISPTLTTICDDEVDPLLQNGLYSFDTSTFESTILNGQTGVTVSYFDAMGNPLASPLPNPFTTVTQNITAVVENPINTTCKATLTIPFVVNPTPKIKLFDNELICTNLPTFLVTINAGLVGGSPSSNTYQWFLEGVLIPGATNYTLSVNTGGIYTVEVTNAFGCSKVRTIDVYASDIAHIDDIKIVDLSDINSVEVIVSGTGNYVYSLDDSLFQTSNFFTNVPMGLHTVYIKDLNECGLVIKEISVLGVPQYFTPNGDGYHDTWNIKGANSEFYSKSIIHIFDRFGKLIKQIKPIGPGWDGTYNGQLAPSDDYWYSIQFDDGRSAKGHFSLKR